MGKCKSCGKKKLFLKLKDGLCPNCVIEAEHRIRLETLTRQIQTAEQQLEDKNRLLSDARAAADKRVVQELEARQKDLLTSIESKSSLLDMISEQYQKTFDKEEKAQKSLRSAQAKTEKIKYLGVCIQNAFQSWIKDTPEIILNEHFFKMDLEELLPSPDLNCLTMKQLRARYNVIHKQILETNESFAKLYTTKSYVAICRLMVMGLEAEIMNVLGRLNFGKLDTAIDAVKEITAKYYSIVVDNHSIISPTMKKYIGLLEAQYIELVETEYEYYVQRERAREEQRALREQMRQEAEERKRLEQERKQVEAEEKKYQQEIDRITAQMQQAHDDELAKLRKRLEEMNTLMVQVEEKKNDIVNLQNGKAGTVYIISNIGSFGDHVFKIGMTRRLEPQDRVNELGDASVPFPFDVHSFIFSEDAVALENALHRELNNRRINKINLRKEFFDISIEELQALVERIDPTAPFRVTALAEQYRQSLSVTSVPENINTDTDDE